ncbi:MAG: glycosyltransferase [Pseudomonadota bacterium]
MALNVVFAGGNGYPPEDSGGVQSSTHDLATRLLARGDRPAVLAPLYGDGWFGLAARARLKAAGGGVVRDTRPGYPVYRGWDPALQVADVVRRTQANVAVVQCHGTVPLAQAFRAAGVPVVIYLRNVEFHELGGDLTPLSDARFIANSDFTARSYRDRYGIEATVIPPTIDPALYATEVTGDAVTFINPVAEKGVARAIQIAAACPEIPFLFVESWVLDDTALAKLQRAIAPYPNIRFNHRSGNMKAIYGQSRLVLAPSRWEEAWGRVASEAQCSGIPVVGSTRGGLPEAIGPGGVTLDYDAPLDDWVGAVRDLWSDAARHAALSTAARAYAARPQIDPARQFEVFESVIHSALAQASAA